MSGSIPYLGSKISLISKSEIRYEGILYTIDAQESIIALAKVRSFGTEDRPTEMPVPARDEVYEYIIFRGTDIKKIEVCDTPKVSSLHNDPAILQHSAPTSNAAPSTTGNVVGTSFQQSSFHRQSLGPIGGAIGGAIGQNQSYSSGGGFDSSQSLQQNSIIQPSFMGDSSQPSELEGGIVVGGNRIPGSVILSPGGSNSGAGVSGPGPIAPPQSSVHNHSSGRQDVLGGSRSSTPGLIKSPVSEPGVQVASPVVESSVDWKNLQHRQPNIQDRQPRESFNGQIVGGNQRFNRENQGFPNQQREFHGYNRDFQRNDGRDYRDHQRDFREKIRGDPRDFGGEHMANGRDFRDQRLDGRDYYREGGQRDNRGFHREGSYQGYRENYQNRNGGYYQGGYYPQQMHMNRGGRMTRRPNPGRGARGGFSGTRGGKQDTTKFEKEFDFEQANEEFEELRTHLAKTKISDKVSEDGDNAKEVERKEDSGHETAPGEDSEDSSSSNCYDKTKSFFDSISCEALERSKGRSQRPDWRQERKINVQTFGVATARRGFFQRGRGYYRGGYYNGNNNRNSFGNQGYYNNNRGGGQNSRVASSEATAVTNGTTEAASSSTIGNTPTTSTYASTLRNATEVAAK